MTEGDEPDRAVMKAAKGLDIFVSDELYTRGGQAGIGRGHASSTGAGGAQIGGPVHRDLRCHGQRGALQARREGVPRRLGSCSGNM
ncbi:MAG: hypothetical protein GY859_11120 [Desulfobacterales bacterium]|nr:hypothetical protein [Desulfobacterales bacterium]